MPGKGPSAAGPPEATGVRLAPRDWAAWPWWLRPLPALGLAAAVALVLAAVAPDRWWTSTRLVGAYLVTPFGQEIWLLLGRLCFGLPPAYVAILLLLVNLSVSLFFALVIPVEALARRLPRIGKRIAAFEDRVRANPQAQRGLFVALAVVVALPIHSGGAILGTLAGRAVGLRPLQTVAAVTLAVGVRLLGGLAIAYGYIGLDLPNPGC